MASTHVYEVRPRKDRRGVDLISDALPFGRLLYGGPDATSNALDYAKFFSRAHRAVIRVYDVAMRWSQRRLALSVPLSRLTSLVRRGSA